MIEEKPNSKKERLPITDVNNFKAVAIFLIGLIGLNIIYNVIFIIVSLFISLDPAINPDQFNSINGALQFATYLIGLATILMIIGIPTIKKIFEKYRISSVYINGIVMGIVLLFAQSLYSILSTFIFGEIDSNNNQQALIALTQQSPILLFITTVILAPVFEELVYRYGLFGLIHKKNRILSYVICLIIFGFIHFDYTCITSGDMNFIKTELINLPAYMISGGILCYSYEKNGSLISSITAHALNNLIAFIQIMILF